MDEIWTRPQLTFEERRQLLLDFNAAHAPGGRVGFFSQIARLALGAEPVDEGPFRGSLAIIDARLGCADFAVAGMLRVLYLYRDSPLISPELIEE